MKGFGVLAIVLSALGFYGLSLAPIVWSRLPEIFPIASAGRRFPSPSRPCGSPVSWLTYTFPLFLRRLGITRTCWIYAGVCLLGFLVVYFFVPETKGKSLEQIERELVDCKGRVAGISRLSRRIMFDPQAYQLLDFGEGRRLERVGGVVLDRPCPAAENMPHADAAAWTAADALSSASTSKWGAGSSRGPCPNRGLCARPICAGVAAHALRSRRRIREQVANWQWIVQQAARAVAAAARPRVLNLFGYTGGSTLAALAAGAEVWLRCSAEHRGLGPPQCGTLRPGTGAGALGRQGRFEVRQARFRRGNRYQAVILDPPSYGHGPHGEVWRLSKHLGRLLGLCGELTAAGRQFMLLTCHTPGFDPPRLARMMDAALVRIRPATRPARR